MKEKGEKQSGETRKTIITLGVIVMVAVIVGVAAACASYLAVSGQEQKSYAWLEDYRQQWGYNYSTFHKDPTMPWEPESYQGTMTNRTCIAHYASNQTISVTRIDESLLNRTDDHGLPYKIEGGQIVPL